MHQTLLSPAEVTATYRGGVLTIEVKGEADSVGNLRIVEISANPGEPPRFRVQAEQHSGQGIVAYQGSDDFNPESAPQQIALQTPAGNRLVTVTS